MNIQGLSDSGLKGLHDGIRKALISDRANSAQSDPYFGVLDHTDWAIWRDALEEELKRRGLTYQPLSW